MRQKKLTLVVAVFVIFSFVAVSSAQAVIDPVSLTVIGFSALIALIVGDNALKSDNNDSVAKQITPEQKIEGSLQVTYDITE